MEKTAKIVFIGQVSVGKSSLLSQFGSEIKLNGTSISPTIAAAFNRKKVISDGKTINLDIWDTSGQERYYGISKIYFRRSTCCVLVFDINNRSTFDKLNSWKRMCDEAHNETGISPAYFLVANKIDRKKSAISQDEIDTWCENNNIYKFVQTSAFTGEGISLLYDTIIKYVSNLDFRPINIVEINKMQSESSSCVC